MKRRANSATRAAAGLAASLLATVAVAAGGRVLAPMDVVTIRIVEAPDLDTTTRVETDGTIDFPYLGRIRAAGLTQAELARRIGRGLVERKIIAGP